MGQGRPTPNLHSDNYNYDVDVPDAVLEGSPSAGRFLRDDDLIAEFAKYDHRARRAKRWFHVLGVTSLVFAALALGVEVWSITLRAAQHPLHHGLDVWLHATALVALVLLAANRFGGFRRRWCESAFLRERLRQYHFQRLLDGDLLELEAIDPAEYVKRTKQRWARFQALATDPTGALASFLDEEGHEAGWFHDASVPTDETLAAELFEVLGEFRVMQQHRHAKRILSGDKTRGRIALAEKMRWSEAVATMSLPIAVLFTVATFAALLWTNSEFAPAVLGGVALTFAVLSAATRAYRAGQTLPGEADLYEEYSKRVEHLRREFFAYGQTLEGAWAIMEQLETESIRELRSFLRQKTRAAFLI